MNQGITGNRSGAIRCRAVLLALVWICGLPVFASPVQAWEGDITLPSYMPHPDDVNPRFRVYEGSIYYPYTTQDHLTTEKRDVAWRALFIENEYLRVTCLPDIGGRLHSVFDKTTGEEMFYTNQVIKPGLIGLRGAWISGGVEWNHGPQGHTVTSFSPADTVLVTNDDGSASIVTGGIQLVTRQVLTVTVTLHPGKAYLDEHIRIDNPTDLPQPYYFWNNTAFPHHEGVRFIYPMTLGTDHGGTNFFSWPMFQGKDITWLKNYDQPTSVFAYECEFDFFGAYDVTKDRGIVATADHNILVGKKAWTWSGTPEGKANLNNLTDDGTEYIEVQTGPLATQADYGLLPPGGLIEWDEYWYPVHGLGDGFEFANREIAIQTRWLKGGPGRSLEVRAISTAEYPEASIHVVHDRGDVTRTIDLSPSQPVRTTFSVGKSRTASIEVTDRDGRVLITYDTPLAIPLKTPPELPAPAPADQKTAEQHYLDGVLYEKQLNPKAARESYGNALASDAGFAPALRNLGALAISSAQFDSAVAYLEQAVGRDGDDALAWYYLGAAEIHRDNLDDAIEAAFKAVHANEQALGYDLAGRAYMRKGEYEKALQAFMQSSAYGSGNPRTADHIGMALLALGRNNEAITAANGEIARRPFEYVPRLIHAYAENPDVETQSLALELASMAGEDEYTFIEAAAAFADCGLYRYAAHTLSMCQSILPGRPLPRYYAGYYRTRLGDAEGGTQEWIEAAGFGEADHVFPNRVESVAVLESVLTRRPEDAFAAYLLGNLYAGLDRPEEAATAWKNAVESPGPWASVAYRNLGLHAWKYQKDLAEADKYYRMAISACETDQTLYRDLALVELALDKPRKAIVTLTNMPETNARRLDTVVLLARAYLASEQLDEALALLENTVFSNREGNTESWRLFHDAHMTRGKRFYEAGDYTAALADFQAALTYPENLGVGRPLRAEEAEEHYWTGMTHQQLGNKKDARKAFKAGAQAPEGSSVQNEYKARCAEGLAR